jgi:hypothetical protein
MIEDKILDLVLVFESLQHTLSKIQRQCQFHCVPERCSSCTCSRIIDEFEEQIDEVQVNLKKAEVLHRRSQGTAHLVSISITFGTQNILC